jgi:glycosyltransferase involved in cell wall biosynthesis
MTTSRAPRVAFAWNELPEYAARVLARARQRLGPDEVPIVANPARVPVQGLDNLLGRVHWIDDADRPGWSDLGLTVPDVFFVVGWKYRHFARLRREVRAAGGHVIGIFDNSFKGNLRQRIGRWAVAWWLRRAFRAVLVPGSSGRRFMEYLGFAPDRIEMGMNGADPELFTPGPPLAERPRRMLFVGQFIERKRVLELLEAFAQVRAEAEGNGDGWTLELIGQGPDLDPAAPPPPGVEIRPFAQAPIVAEAMRRSRVVVLPSREDHWGLVVHEAALSGCAIVTTDGVAAALDLVTPVNGVVTDHTRVEDLARGLREVIAWSEAQWHAAEAESLKRAQSFGPDVFAAAVERLLTRVTDS